METPISDVDPTRSPCPGYTLVAPQLCKSSQVFSWFGESKRIFKLAPGAWVGSMVLWFILLLVLSIVPVVGQLLSTMLNYILLAGLMIGCQAVFDGHKFELKYLFAGFSSHLWRLILLALIASVVSAFVMWMTIDPAYFDPAVFADGTLPAGLSLTELSLSILIAMTLLIPLFMGLWFAPILIVLQNLSVIDAMGMSFKGCFINTLPFLLYGLIALPLLTIGIMTLGLGLLVIMPMLVISIFTSYRQIFLVKDSQVVSV